MLRIKLKKFKRRNIDKMKNKKKRCINLPTKILLNLIAVMHNSNLAM